MEFAKSPECAMIVAELDWFVNFNKENVKKKLLDKDLSRDELVEKLDQVIEVRGMNKVAMRLRDKFTVESIKISLKDLEERLDEELKKEEEEPIDDDI